MQAFLAVAPLLACGPLVAALAVTLRRDAQRARRINRRNSSPFGGL